MTVSFVCLPTPWVGSCCDFEQAMRSMTSPIAIAQAGQINTNAFDPMVGCPDSHRYGAWVHVDGARIMGTGLPRDCSCQLLLWSG
jgi:hypothetical protein